MRKAINWPRLALSLAFGLPVVWLLAAQAFSSVWTTKDPRLSLSILPSNGLARGQLAFQSLVTGQIEGGGSMPSPSGDTIALALQALNDDPLVAKTHVILALAQSDETQSRKILDAASQLNRRDLALQGLVLQKYTRAEDPRNTITTLDQILRVHPEYYREFFQIMSDALARTETLPLFADVLDGTSPWHERFLLFAVRRPALLASLAKLRPDLKIQNDDFNRILIAGLVEQGMVSRAATIYQSLSGTTETSDSGYRLGWASNYPPFDWQFVDEAGFRAQESIDGNALDISVRSGKGGILGQRLLSTPETPFKIEVTSIIRPIDRSKDVRLQLSCINAPSPFLDQELQAGRSRLMIEQTPSDCEYVELALWARAWSGGRNLALELEEIILLPAENEQ